MCHTFNTLRELGVDARAIAKLNDDPALQYLYIDTELDKNAVFALSSNSAEHMESVRKNAGRAYPADPSPSEFEWQAMILLRPWLNTPNRKKRLDEAQRAVAAQEARVARRAELRTEALEKILEHTYETAAVSTMSMPVTPARKTKKSTSKFS